MTPEERIEELEAEVRYWKGEALAIRDLDTEIRIAEAFNLTPQEAWLVTVLFNARGVAIAKERLVDQMPNTNRNDFSDEVSHVNVLTHRIRKKNGRDFIQTIPRTGLRLPPEALSQIGTAIKIYPHDGLFSTKG